MAQIGQFNPNAHEPSQSFDPLPAGWYALKLVNDEVKDTKDGASKYLWGECEIDEAYHPEHKGRKVWFRLNLWNQNEQARSIAGRQFADLCRAVGLVSEISDTEAIKHKTFAAKVSLRPATAEFEASNEIKAFEPVASRFPPNGMSPVGSPAATTTTPAKMAPPPRQQPAAPAPSPSLAPPRQAPTPPSGAPWKR